MMHTMFTLFLYNNNTNTEIQGLFVAKGVNHCRLHD